MHTPKGPPHGDSYQRVADECKHSGIGLLTFDVPTDFDSYEVHVEPMRQVPEPHALNEFLAVQLSTRPRDKLRRWLR